MGTSLNNNIMVLFTVGLLSTFVLGVFEIMFPLYLNHRGVSLLDMGVIFSVSTLAIVLFRIFIGAYSDVYGRKRLYLVSSTLGALANGLFPFSIGKIGIFFNKILNDLHDHLKASVHDIMLYENAQQAYVKLLSWFTTSNFIVQAIGNLSLAVLLLRLGYSGSFFLLAAVQVATFAVLLLYREGKPKSLDEKVSLKEAYSLKMQRNLKVLCVSSAIGVLGFGIAHGFLLPLYFSAKYGLDVAQIAVVTAIHRLSFLTTPLSGKVIAKFGVRKTYIFSTSAYAFAFLTVGLFTFPITVFLPIFLLHDLVGGGIRMTATSVIVQSLTTNKRRGRDINLFNALQTPMSILAPTLASILAAANWDLIFIAGGLLFSVSLLTFKFFFKEESLA